MMHSCIERKTTIWSLYFIFSLSNLILNFASSETNLCRPDQKDALLEFRANFLPTSSFGATTLIAVLGIEYYGLVLNRPLRFSSSLFRLQHLEYLNLDNSNIYGILPHSIGNLKYLSGLSLSECNFCENIPSSLGNLSDLTNHDLSFNDFTGELPSSMDNFIQLSELHLRFNKLRGNFPPMLLNLSNLNWINLEYNQFEGNHFSGPLMIKNISSPSALEHLNLGENNLVGPISGFISKLIALLDLSFWNTEMGMVDFSIFSHLVSISSTLYFPSSIGILVLSSCNISEFPKFLQNQTSLVHLDISANQIEGQIPKLLWKLQKLEYVNFSQNLLKGFEGSAD
ncbi:hypothetical protein EUTSA_v10024074mg, partial [Eutrema salsugineum]